MRVIIEVECDNAAFDEYPIREIKRILLTCPKKILEQAKRKPCLCDAPESADKLMDSNGNTVGFVKLER